MDPAYTPRQGQFLAFIYYYTKLNGVPPAEAEGKRAGLMVRDEVAPVRS